MFELQYTTTRLCLSSINLTYKNEIYKIDFFIPGWKLQTQDDNIQAALIQTHETWDYNHNKKLK